MTTNYSVEAAIESDTRLGRGAETATLWPASVTQGNASPALRDNDRTLAAAQWLADLSVDPPDVINEIRERFEIGAWEASIAVSRANGMRICRRAFA